MTSEEVEVSQLLGKAFSLCTDSPLAESTIQFALQKSTSKVGSKPPKVVEETYHGHGPQ